MRVSKHQPRRAWPRALGRDGDDGVGDGAAEVGFGGFLHLEQNHGRDLCANCQLATQLNELTTAHLLGSELFALALVLDLDDRLVASFRKDLEWPVLHVALNFGIGLLAAD